MIYFSRKKYFSFFNRVLVIGKSTSTSVHKDVENDWYTNQNKFFESGSALRLH